MYPPLPHPDEVGVPNRMPQRGIFFNRTSRYNSFVGSLSHFITPVRRVHCVEGSSRVMALQTVLVMCVTWMTQLWCEMCVSAAIARGLKGYLWSVPWLLLAGPFIALFTTFVTRTTILSRSMVVTFWAWLLTSVLCVPHAYSASLVASADTYLAPNTHKFIHCWQNNDDVVTMANTNYITLSESVWKVEWEQTWKQKVVTVAGTEEDEDKANRYNYCVAPITYTGLAPNCKYRFYAACYVQTIDGHASHCDETAAKSCEWHLPGNAVTLRVMNTGAAEFFGEADEVEGERWRSAVALVGSVDPLPVVVTYAADSRAVLMAARDEAEELAHHVSIASYGLFGVIILVCSLREAWRSFKQEQPREGLLA